MFYHVSFIQLNTSQGGSRGEVGDGQLLWSQPPPAAVAGLLELVLKSSLVAVVACVVGMWTSHAWKGL